MSINPQENLALKAWEPNYMELHPIIESSAVYQKHIKEVADEVVRGTPHNGILLEVGAGKGNLLAIIREMRPDIKLVAVEPHPVFRDRLKEIGADVIEQMFPFEEDTLLPSESIDTIVFLNSWYTSTKSKDTETATTSRMAMIGAAYELLTRNGTLIISDPLDVASASTIAVIGSLKQEILARQSEDSSSFPNAAVKSLQLLMNLQRRGFLEANRDIRSTHRFIGEREFHRIMSAFPFKLIRSKKGYFRNTNLLATYNKGEQIVNPERHLASDLYELVKGALAEFNSFPTYKWLGLTAEVKASYELSQQERDLMAKIEGEAYAEYYGVGRSEASKSPDSDGFIRMLERPDIVSPPEKSETVHVLIKDNVGTIIGFYSLFETNKFLFEQTESFTGYQNPGLDGNPKNIVFTKIVRNIEIPSDRLKRMGYPTTSVIAFIVYKLLQSGAITIEGQMQPATINMIKRGFPDLFDMEINSLDGRELSASKSDRPSLVLVKVDKSKVRNLTASLLYNSVKPHRRRK